MIYVYVIVVRVVIISGTFSRGMCAYLFTLYLYWFCLSRSIFTYRKISEGVLYSSMGLDVVVDLKTEC